MMQFEKAMIAGLHGDEWDWDDAKRCAMDFITEHVGTLEKHEEKNVVYGVKNMIMLSHAVQSIINDGITDANMPRNHMFQAVTEINNALIDMKKKEYEKHPEEVPHGTAG